MENSGSESAGTSIKQVAAGLKKLVEFDLIKEGQINLDWGGGKYDDGIKYLAEQGIQSYVYDPYNRSIGHNFSTLINVMDVRGGADCATLLNVLNVIPTKEERISVIEEVLWHIKDEASLLISVYPGSTKGQSCSKRGWQNNEPIAFYKKELIDSLEGVSIEQRGKYLILKKIPDILRFTNMK